MAATYLYGKNSVVERLKVNPKSVQKVYVRQGFDDKEILSLCQHQRKQVVHLSDRDLEKLKPKARTQGVLAQVDNFQYTDFDELLSAQDPWIILFLDRVMDPHNVGSIMRIAACFGKIALCIPKHNACEVTEAALHVSSGGENYVPVALVSNTLNAVIKAKQKGYWIAASLVGSATALPKADFPKPIGIILGTEGEGVGPALQKHVDYRVTIPMPGHPLSLNVAMASAIICYELRGKS